ncbi:MAG: HD domain-containing protein [Candidatus Eremiobacterota bacterium]
MLFEAVSFAADAHKGQYRKGTPVPYIVHPVSVMRILLTHGASEPLACAGVLHDTVEDTPVTVEELASRFSPEIASLVEAVSEPDKAAPWKERKEHTLRSLRDCSLSVVLLSLSDKVDNAETMALDRDLVGEALWGRFKTGKADQLWYYGGLLEVFRSRAQGSDMERLVARLAAAVDRAFAD